MKNVDFYSVRLLNGFRCVLLLSMIFLVSMSAWSQQDDTNVCDGLTGAAWGLCTSAVEVGCDDPTAETEAACSHIAESYRQMTGDEPSWLNPCPCGFDEPTLAVITSTFTGDVFSTAECIISGSEPKVKWGLGGNAIDTNVVLWSLSVTDISNTCSATWSTEPGIFEEIFYPPEQDFDQTKLNCRRTIAELAELVHANPNECVLP